MKNKTTALSILLIALMAFSLSAEYVPFKVSLTVLERLVIGTLLPKETNFTTWKIVNDLKNDIALTESELKTLNMKPNPEGEGIIANWGDVPEKEVVFGEVAEKMIIDALKNLDSENKLLEEHLTVYQKFVNR